MENEQATAPFDNTRVLFGLKHVMKAANKLVDASTWMKRS